MGLQHLILFLLLSPQNFARASRRKTQNREARFFSVMNIVRFNNGECATQAAGRAGTCLSATECSQDGGAPSGSCAAGFGVCCLFDLSSCDSTVTRNCSYVQNPGFPASLANGGGDDRCDFFVNKCNADICFLRLDLDVFDLIGPTGTDEAANGGGACDTDSFVVVDNDGPAVPVICGENAGQHIYVELIPGDASEQISLQFRLGGALALGALRRWQIKITQIECNSTNRPPSGCLQFFTSPSGRITTFNFSPEAGTIHLENQRYSTCIRGREGFCCVVYSLCDGVAMSFTLSNVIPAASSGTDNACVEDYVGVEASSNVCNEGDLAREPFVSKYCGRILNSVEGLMANSPICDCTPPFLVDFVTDGGAALMQAMARDRGVCLDYNLRPCSN